MIFCFAAMILLFSGCKDKNSDMGNEQKNCAHSYADGICEICGEADQSHAPESGSENEEENLDDNSEIPPIDTDGETELPFVPAV